MHYYKVFGYIFRCQYEILLVLENEIKYYKTNGRYLSVSGNDLYIRCSEVMDIIVKTGIWKILYFSLNTVVFEENCGVAAENNRLAIVAAPKAATAGNAEEAGAKAQRRKARPASKVFEQREKCLRKAGNRQRTRRRDRIVLLWS